MKYVCTTVCTPGSTPFFVRVYPINLMYCSIADVHVRMYVCTPTILFCRSASGFHSHDQIYVDRKQPCPPFTSHNLPWFGGKLDLP